MKMKVKMKNRSYRCNTDSPGSRHGHKYSKYKKCLSMYAFSNAEATFEAQFMKS